MRGKATQQYIRLSGAMRRNTAEARRPYLREADIFMQFDIHIYKGRLFACGGEVIVDGMFDSKGYVFYFVAAQGTLVKNTIIICRGVDFKEKNDIIFLVKMNLIVLMQRNFHYKQCISI